MTLLALLCKVAILFGLYYAAHACDAVRQLYLTYGDGWRCAVGLVAVCAAGLSIALSAALDLSEVLDVLRRAA